MRRIAWVFALFGATGLAGRPMSAAEPSTRTRLSFETAAKRLSADTMTFARNDGVFPSSARKNSALNTAVSGPGVPVFTASVAQRKGVLASGVLVGLLLNVGRRPQLDKAAKDVAGNDPQKKEAAKKEIMDGIANYNKANA